MRAGSTWLYPTQSCNLSGSTRQTRLSHYRGTAAKDDQGTVQLADLGEMTGYKRSTQYGGRGGMIRMLNGTNLYELNELKTAYYLSIHPGP
jgi:hypothetical protein